MFFYMIQIDTQDRSNNTEEILTIPDHLVSFTVSLGISCVNSYCFINTYIKCQWCGVGDSGKDVRIVIQCQIYYDSIVMA
jgi:hypothetical protein